MSPAVEWVRLLSPAVEWVRLLSAGLHSLFQVSTKALPVALKMDTDWTFSSQTWLWDEDLAFKKSCSGSSWSREEDKAFENALAMYYNDVDRWEKIASSVPGKTVEDIKLHFEALSDDVAAIESGKVPLPHYPSNASVHRKKKKSSETSVQRGVPWTEEEHGRFLYGLQRFGRGDWKSISRYSVRTKSNSQVASHAQKYFKRLKANEGKRPSINDIRSVNPESLSALEKETTSCMPKEKSTTTGNHKPPPKNGDENLSLTEHPNEVSANSVNQLFSVYPGDVPTNTMDQLLSPTPFSGIPAPFSGHVTFGRSTPVVPVCNVFTTPFAGQPTQVPDPLVGIPSTSYAEDIDLDEFVFPHFLD